VKFLIFGHHRKVLDAIEEEVKKLKPKAGYMRIDGSTSIATRQDNVNKFQTDDSCKIAILSITAAGIGITLTAATTVVFAELYWNPSQLLQCEDRAHRISQESVVNVVYLIARGTLDDRLWDMVTTKLSVLGKTLCGKAIQMDIASTKELYEQSTAKKKRKKKKGDQRSLVDMLTPTQDKKIQFVDLT